MGKQNPEVFEAMVKNKTGIAKNNFSQEVINEIQMHQNLEPSNTEFDQASLLFSKVSRKSIRTTNFLKNTPENYAKLVQIFIDSSDTWKCVATEDLTTRIPLEKVMSDFAAVKGNKPCRN